MSESKTCLRCGTRVVASRADGLRGICPRCLFEALVEPERSAARTPLELLEGQELGNYRVLGLLGAGGMGVVYRARQKGLERTVALKVLNAPGREELERFFVEARAAARLQHPNIVAIHEVSDDRGYYFFTMELVEGRSLSGSGRMNPKDAAEVVARIARAVHYAHEQGIIHRDLKPANILLTASGEPKVMDFGLAKDVSSDAGLTQTGTAMGTPAYMPPEQALGEKPTRRCDVYSLGAVLYECLSARPPFTGASVPEILRKVADEEPARIAGVDRDLETICLKALQKDPARRYPTALALAEDLERFARGDPILGRRPGLLYRVRRLASRPGVALAVGTVCVAIAVLAGMRWLRPELRHTEPLALPGGAPGVPEEERRLARSHLDRGRQHVENAHRLTSPEDRARRQEWLRDAVSELNRAAEVDPTSADIHFWLGRAHQELQDWKTAIGAFGEAVRLDADRADARYHRFLADFSTLYYQRISTLAFQPYHDRMKGDLEALKRLNAPEDWTLTIEAMLWMFLAIAETRSLDDLSRRVDRILAANPGNAYGYLLRHFLRLTRQDPAAMEDLRKAVELEPNNLLFRLMLSEGLQRSGHEEALKQAMEAAAIAPWVEHGHLECAAMFLEMGKTEEAWKRLDQALEVAKDPADVRMCRANVHIEGKIRSFSFPPPVVPDDRYLRAKIELDLGLTAQPGHAVCLYLRGMIQMPRDPEAARRDLCRYLELVPEDHMFVDAAKKLLEGK